jgi:hypothetical protein
MQALGMEIRIQVEAQDPPVGRAGRAQEEAEPFSGWLGLLRLLSELMEVGLTRSGGPPERPTPPGRTGRAS